MRVELYGCIPGKSVNSLRFQGLGVDNVYYFYDMRFIF